VVWHIGNTTVRTPYRLRAALIALAGSYLHGNLLGRENEEAFANLLHGREVLYATRLVAQSNQDHSDLGRKWRSALSQLGFLASHRSRGHQQGVDLRLESLVQGISGLSGRPYEITPSGWRLVNSKDLIAQQECFLRALTAYRIPSPLEPRYRNTQFSPLHFVLDIFRALEERSIERVLSFQEMALFVQRSTAEDSADAVAERIYTFRVARTNHAGSLTSFVRTAYEHAILEDQPDTPYDRIASKANTLVDYADLTLRYLKATGLFNSKGRGILVARERSQLAEYVRKERLTTLDDRSYLRQLWHGASLPTDERSAAIAVVRDLDDQIRQRGVTPTIADIKRLDDVGLQEARLELEGQLRLLNEREYARQQAAQVDEITSWMDAILTRGRATLPDGSILSIPKGEMPAYLEWIIWRAFLAFNSLENEPWDARRFQIDQDNLPIGTAPGSGPDMSFVFKDAIIVVEVTLTSSSRQEAAEGEPVRRHVAQYAEDDLIGKSVYGLFIAPEIDTNTAHTFKSGDWYRRDDSKINLHIVPMRLEDFRDLFKARSLSN